jgi:hypothetical protein
MGDSHLAAGHRAHATQSRTGAPLGRTIMVQGTTSHEPVRVDEVLDQVADSVRDLLGMAAIAAMVGLEVPR